MASEKSPDALRTIGEVADELDIATHVLRFWESKFNQIKPQKRRGRRYYRPDDVKVIKEIRTLLYDKGYTIRGVQKFLVSSKTTTNVAGNDNNLLENNQIAENINDSSSSQQMDDIQFKEVLTNNIVNAVFHEENSKIASQELAELEKIRNGLRDLKERLKNKENR